MTEGLSIKGLQEAQRGNLRTINAMRPSGSFGRAIIYATSQAHRFAVANSHVGTGTMRAAHRMEITGGGLHGRIFLDPDATNPRSGQKPSEYGVFEHARGGQHAFYQRVLDEHETSIVQGAAVVLVGGMP